MQNEYVKKKLIVLSPSWPTESGGYGIAVRASLLLYLDHFQDICFICLSQKPFFAQKDWPDNRIEWIHIPIFSSYKWIRFLRSFFGRLPAIANRFARAQREVLSIIHRLSQTSFDNKYLIAEDIPVACLLPEIHRKFPEMPLAIRSHNMTAKAFEPFCFAGSPLVRLAWKIEVSRIKRFEKRICQTVDRLWTISEEDSQEYYRRFSVKSDGTIGVCLNIERYEKVEIGDVNTVVHVGTADLRKGKGLADFIFSVWPKVRAEVPGARLILAGRGTQRFTNYKLGIEGLGFVDDDRNVLRKGLIFINPQQIGSGVQLKSIVAMLSGKCLVSTKMGVEGIYGKNNENFYAVDSIDEMADTIVELMENPVHAINIGRLARVSAKKTYSKKWFLKYSKPLLNDFVHKLSK